MSSVLGPSTSGMNGVSPSKIDIKVLSPPYEPEEVLLSSPVLVAKESGFTEFSIAPTSKSPPPYVPCMIVVVRPGAKGPTRGVRK